MLRRLEDRIKELSRRVTSAQDPDELSSVVLELRFVIHQNVQRVRARAFSGHPERRNRGKRVSGGDEKEQLDGKASEG